MNIVNSANATKPDAYALTDYQSTRLTQSSVNVQASAGISLVTADGDKVTLAAAKDKLSPHTVKAFSFLAPADLP